MPVFVVGLNHRSAPLELLERLAIGPERRPKALAQLLDRDHVKEGAILSTCNRVEVYAEIDRFHDGGDAVRSFLTELQILSFHEQRRAAVDLVREVAARQHGAGTGSGPQGRN